MSSHISLDTCCEDHLLLTVLIAHVNALTMVKEMVIGTYSLQIGLTVRFRVKYDFPNEIHTCINTNRTKISKFSKNSNTNKIQILYLNLNQIQTFGIKIQLSTNILATNNQILLC